MGFADLRIALVGPLPPPAGGMANQTRQLAELLRAEGARVELVQTNAPYRPGWIGRVRGVRALFRLLPYLWRLWRAFGRADVVHVMANSGWSWTLFAAPAVHLAALRRVPAVVNYRGGEAGPFLARSATRVGATMRRAAALVLPSGFLLEVFAHHGMRGQIVPNVVDLERFSPAAGDGRRRGAHLVVARNLEAIYGIDVALRAFALVLAQRPEARLSVAGSGPEEGALRALAVELGIATKVEFTGRLDREQMAALYRSADLTINPSRVDNMPNSVLESLACGVPVVSTRVGGVPYIVEDGLSALLVPPDAPEAMADAVLRVLADAQLAGALARKGLEEVRRYEWARVREQWLAVYRRGLGESGGEALRGA